MKIRIDGKFPKDGPETLGLGLFLRKQNALVLSDLHMGYEEALSREGYMIPVGDSKKMIAQILRLIDEARPDIVVLNGDIKHEFGSILDQEWRDSLMLIDSIQKRCRLEMISGNHDAMLEPLARKRGITLKDHILLGETYVCHGHSLPDKDDADFAASKLVVVGHAHPALTISDPVKSEKFKAFLVGTFNGKTKAGKISTAMDKGLIIMPTFNPYVYGIDVSAGEVFGPFMHKKDIGSFHAIISHRQKAFDFGKVSSLM